MKPIVIVLLLILAAVSWRQVYATVKWRVQEVRMAASRVIDVGEEDWAHDDLRRSLAPQMRALMPGYGSCKHCGWPWPLTDDGRVVDYEWGEGGWAKTGHFAVCNRCWKFLREFEGGDDYLRELYRASFIWSHATAGETADGALMDAAMDKALSEERQTWIRPMPKGRTFPEVR